MLTVAAVLEQRREQLGLTRTEWCDLLGMQQSHYSSVVTGARPLPIKATRKAFAFGVPADVLLQGEPPICGTAIPPLGWWCSREAGHRGPCAARPCGVEGRKP